MFKQLKTAIAQYANLSEDDYSTLLPCFTSLKVEKNTKLVKLGHVATHLYFINKGAIRTFILPDVEEIHTGLYFENTFVSSITSFIDQAPSKQVVEAIEDCELLCLSKSDYDMLNNSILRMNEFSRKMIQWHLVLNARHTESLICDEPEERFRKMIKTQPNVLDRVRPRYIASYLEIPLLQFAHMVENMQDKN